MVFEGDSLSTAFYGDVPALTVAALGSDWTDYYNVAVIGQLVTDMLADAVTDVDGKRDNNKLNYVVFWGGTNDIQAGASAFTTYERIVRYCVARKATGSKVVVSTLIARNIAGFEAIRTQVNDWIRANWTTFADALSDPGADARLSDPTNTTYFLDGTHLKAAGNNIVYPLHVAALLSIL